MNRPQALAVLAAALGVLLFAGCSSSVEDAGVDSAAAGDAVTSMLMPVTPDELESQFNADVGEARLVLLLSPIVAPDVRRIKNEVKQSDHKEPAQCLLWLLWKAMDCISGRSC